MDKDFKKSYVKKKSYVREIKHWKHNSSKYVCEWLKLPYKKYLWIIIISKSVQLMICILKTK